MGTIQRFIGKARVLTIPRIRNGYKIWSSFRNSNKTGVARIKGFPVSVSIEPTTSCNLRCPQCPSGLRQFSRPTGMLDPQLFENIVRQIKKELCYLTFYFQGEPYLNPDFFEMVEVASRSGIFTATSTNAHFLDKDRAEKTVKSGLSRLIISLDGITQESYSKYRTGGNLQKVLEGITAISEARRMARSSFPEIIVQFIVFSHNQHEIKEARREALKRGADKVVLKTAQVYDEKGNELLPSEEFSRYELVDGKAKIKGELQDKCWRMWHSCVITWDGLVVPCCFDKDGKYQMGDLKTQSFGEIWYGKKYNAFRQQLFDNRKSIDICNNCSEGAQVFI